MPEVKTVYQEAGYKNREEYLQSLADDYGVDTFTMETLSDILGESEDFDGLIIEIENYQNMFGA
jgi:hypothetical protein